MPDLEIFIDDSGDSESCLSFTALCMQAGTSAEARRIVSADIEPLLTVFRLGDEFELHGSELLRDGGLKSYQREFLYRHCLEVIATFPTMVVATVHWNWFPHPYREEDQPRAWRHRLLWTRLLELLDEIALAQYDELHQISAMTVDRSFIQDRLLDEHDTYVRGHAGTRILCKPEFNDSASDRLLQAADLCAFAADLHSRPFVVGDTRRAKPAGGPAANAVGFDWYPLTLRSRFAYCVSGGVRRVAGAAAS